ncbi:hypothetical protein QJQ45_029366 [Haematococcus lacustris]|nr:hypothetical protein QJQ45_029366 [Haematococcus lacustris]
MPACRFHPHQQPSSRTAELPSIRGTLLGGHLAMQRSALPTTPQPRGQPCRCLTPLSLTSLKPGAGAKSNSNNQHEETGEEPGAAAKCSQEQQPTNRTAKMCSKEAHLGAAAISHTAQLPRWRMT